MYRAYKEALIRERTLLDTKVSKNPTGKGTVNDFTSPVQNGYTPKPPGGRIKTPTKPGSRGSNKPSSPKPTTPTGGNRRSGTTGGGTVAQPRRAEVPRTDPPKAEVPSRADTREEKVDAEAAVEDEARRRSSARTRGGNNEKEVLDVRYLDLNIRVNSSDHHTDDYQLTDPLSYRDRALVIRRGQPFEITVIFDRRFKEGTDNLTLIFTPDDISNGTVEVPISKKQKSGSWNANVKSERRKRLTIEVSTPPNALVAKYSLQIRCELVGGREHAIHKHREYVYLVCNPWCQDDTVYLENDNERREYVLNDKGRVYKGSDKKVVSKPWNFGQFEDFMLDAVFYLLNKSLVMEPNERGDSILLARTIAQVANASNRGGGVLVGNWSGDYSDGVSPMKWTGSVKILEEYWSTKKPVCFGQCWVFSAIVTTMCRCLGIPARSMTNYSSAHDTDSSVTIDSYWNTEGEFLGKSDSVWNFHVWNDVWMTRLDLEPGFGGWQAIDGTPQEPSKDAPGQGLYVCGPAPLSAMKKGNVSLPYDGKFIFAEFNADRINWEVDGDKEKPININKSSVGKNMSTKAVGSNRRQDVTGDYKFREGSEEERATVIRAVDQGSKKKDVDLIYNQEDDVLFNLVEREEDDTTPIGKPLDVEVKISNKSSEKRTIDMTLTAGLVWYNGRPAENIRREMKDVACDGGKESTVKMTIEVNDYIYKLVDMCFVKVDCMARVRETNQIYFDNFMFMLDKPELQIEAPTKVTRGDPYDITVRFTNPFPYPLTKCEFTIEGAGHIRPVTIPNRDIPANEETKLTHSITSDRKGEKEIVVGFDSLELSDLSGTAEVEVIAPDNEMSDNNNADLVADENIEKPDPTEPLSIVTVNTNIESNTRAHHTDNYELTENTPNRTGCLVIRRGQQFDITVTFDREFVQGSDVVKFTVDAEGLPKSMATYIANGSVEIGDAYRVAIGSVSGTKVTFKVRADAYAQVAKWNLKISCHVDGRSTSHELEEPIYLICNPWCAEDPVFMGHEAERNEYVLNDRGKVYKGSDVKPYGKTWNFGQFEDFVLETCLYLLSKSMVMTPEERGNPIKLARTISQMTNVNDDSGVCWGKWGGDYSDGVSPMAWNGSVAILKQYWETKEPVKYAQCWVFSAVVVTLCRTIGIPCRSMTNYNSAHDTDGSITIDSYFDKDGESLGGGDSVWNFHVWNDAWMARNDLEPGFGGWQAIDATPQEASQETSGKGLSVCGPASVLAMKRGNVAMPYDAKFIFAEFNADRVTWQVDEKGEKKPIRVGKYSVGNSMSTKAVGSNDRYDVTREYKFPEGSKEERATVIRAVEQGSKAADVAEIYDQTEDVIFEMLGRDRVNPLGEALDVELQIKNTSDETRSVDVKLTATLVWYNGIPADVIKKQSFGAVCQGKESTSVRMNISVDEYVHKLVDMCYIKVSCMAKTTETHQVYFDNYLFVLDKPVLDVQAPTSVKSGESYDVTISFRNPFPYPLTKCEFSLEGAGHLRPLTQKSGDIEANGEAKISMSAISTHRGNMVLVAGFESAELSDLNGEVDITVA